MAALPFGRSGLFASLRAALDSLAGILQVRLEILGLEIREAQLRLVLVLGLLLVAFLLFTLGIVGLWLALVLTLWESDFFMWVAWLPPLGFLGGSGLLAFWLRSYLDRAPALFESTLTELHKDRTWLRPR